MLGAYRLVERTGRVGLTEVWKAQRPELLKTVSIRIIPRALAARAGYIERFRRETRTLLWLNHPNVLHVLDVGEQDGYAYLVSPYITDITLDYLLGQPW